jgi:hypothetical protein
VVNDEKVRREMAAAETNNNEGKIPMNEPMSKRPESRMKRIRESNGYEMEGNDDRKKVCRSE